MRAVVSTEWETNIICDTEAKDIPKCDWIKPIVGFCKRCRQGLEPTATTDMLLLKSFINERSVDSAPVTVPTSLNEVQLHFHCASEFSHPNTRI